MAHEIVPQDNAPVASQSRDLSPQTPSEMMMEMIKSGVTPEQVEKMMDLHEKHERREAEKAFHAAMAAFRKEEIVIAKDRWNDHYKSRYASVSSILNTVNPLLGKHDLTFQQFPIQSDNVERIGIRTTIFHSLGHAVSNEIFGPPDKSGSKNGVQSIKSSSTYLRGIGLELALGVTGSEGTLCDDGNGAGPAPEYITGKAKSEIFDLIEVKIRDSADYLKYCQNAHGVGSSFDEIPVKSATAIRNELAGM